MKWITIFTILILCAGVSLAANHCQDAYLTKFGHNYTTIFELENVSGKFLNDLGDYQDCRSLNNSKYMLGRYIIESSYSEQNIGESFNSYVIGICVPNECTVKDSWIMSNYYTNLSKTFLTENYFNYTRYEKDVTLEYHDVQKDADDKISETESTSSVMIVVIVFLFLLGILGLIVEKTNLANKPNLNDEEDEDENNDFWENMFDNDAMEGNKNISNDDEYEEFKETESKLIMSKTLWGIILLSFSFSRNAKRLFQFSVMKRKGQKYSLTEGAHVFFLFWVMAGNTFLYSFYSYPANFDKKTDISQNYFFITIFNNEFAFDAILFFHGFLFGYEFLEKLDKKKFTTGLYILHIIHFIIRMMFPVVIIIGISSVFPLFSDGPMWSVMTKQITETCDKFLWTHTVFISNLYPFENSVGKGCCLPWLWLVSTIFQFYFFGLILAVMYKKRPKITSIITWAICFGSLLICTIIAVSTNAVSLSQYDSDTYNLIFTKPWSKIFGYSIGLFIGFILYEHSKEDVPENKKRFGWQIVCWLENMNICRRTLLIILAFLMIVLPSIFQWVFLVKDPFSPFGDNNSEKAMYILYITLGKPIFFLGLIIVLLFCLLNKLKWITMIVGNYVWGPMVELSYSAYLVHYFVIVWFYSGLMQTLYVSIPDLAFTSAAVIFMSFALAIPFAFIIEIPSRNLMELVLSGIYKRAETTTTDEKDSSEKVSGNNYTIQAHAVSDMLNSKAESIKAVMQPVIIPKEAMSGLK